MTDCTSTNQTPIAIQNDPKTGLPENGLQCSLTCQVMFDYARPQWQMSAVNITDPTTKRNLLRFYVTNMNNPVKKDIVFNGRDYQLEFIEFYEEAIHQIPIEGETKDYQYPVEMVMYHSSKNSSATPSQPTSTEWLAVSIFVLPQNSYSLSNTFFYQLLNTTLVIPNKENTDGKNQYVFNNKILQADSTYNMNVSWNTPTNLTQTVLVGKSTTSSSPAIQIKVGQFWSPYQALPASKAFYSYTGSFPYNSSLANSNYSEENSLKWILLKNPVSMYQGEYIILQSLFQDDNFLWNNSTTYSSPCIPTARNIMYNDGELVGGNADQDKFYVKCVNKESASATKSFTQDDEIQQLQELSAPSTASSIFTTYHPPQSVMSGLVFCVVFSLVFFVMFASASWVDSSKQDKSSYDLSTIQKSMIALLSIALFVMYGLSFATATWMVGAQPFAMLFWALCLICWTTFAMPYINGYMWEYFNKGPAFKVLGVIIACCSFGPYVLILLSGLSSILLNPMFNLNGQIISSYSYYYTDVATNPTNPSFYIGVKASIMIDFAGYNLNYRNIHGIGSADDIFVQIPIDFYNPQKGDPTSSPPVKPTNPQFMDYNTETISMFTSFGTGDKLVNKTNPNPPVENINMMLLIIEEYDLNMKQKHTNPLQTFVNAIWKITNAVGLYPKTFYYPTAGGTTTPTKPDTLAITTTPTTTVGKKVLTSLTTLSDVASALVNNGLPATDSTQAGVYYDLVSLLTYDFPLSTQYASTARSGA